MPNPPKPSHPFQAPVHAAWSPGRAPVTEGDATGGLIPYRNPPPLIACCLGTVSLLPLVGIPFGIAAFVLGILGLKRRRANPVIKGSVHAIIGIVCGSLSLLCGLVISAFIVVGLLNSR